MFSLIITIISIALVAALAVATIYYGGSAFTQGNTKAMASTLVAQAQQIQGAVTLAVNDGLTRSADLVAGSYLQSMPVAPTKATTGTWAVGASAITIDGVNTDVCAKVADVGGGVASCTAGAFSFAG